MRRSQPALVSSPLIDGSAQRSVTCCTCAPVVPAAPTTTSPSGQLTVTGAPASGAGSRAYARPSMRRSSGSSITATPSSFALSSLEPASSPATTKSVFLLTEPETLPPALLISSPA